MRYTFSMCSRRWHANTEIDNVDAETRNFIVREEVMTSIEADPDSVDEGEEDSEEYDTGDKLKVAKFAINNPWKLGEI